MTTIDDTSALHVRASLSASVVVDLFSSEPACGSAFVGVSGFCVVTMVSFVWVTVLLFPDKKKMYIYHILETGVQYSDWSIYAKSECHSNTMTVDLSTCRLLLVV